jgi:hypothetical protein
LLIGVIVLLTAATGYAVGRALFRPSERVSQPVAFNHRLHVTDLEIDCDLCHEHVQTGHHAGLPRLTTCLECHEEPLTEAPEEQKLIELGQSEDTITFRKRFRIADHTLYSHARHVGEAGLECETCHGGIAATTTPPERPLVRVTMDMCIDCHESSGVSSDCTRCHR